MKYFFTTKVERTFLGPAITEITIMCGYNHCIFQRKLTLWNRKRISKELNRWIESFQRDDLYVWFYGYNCLFEGNVLISHVLKGKVFELFNHKVSVSVFDLNYYEQISANLLDEEYLRDDMIFNNIPIASSFTEEQKLQILKSHVDYPLQPDSDDDGIKTVRWLASLDSFTRSVRVKNGAYKMKK